ncbi:MAG: hypothetical protein ABI224_03415, partial [Acetobacteraceae bacterium]
MAHLDHIELRNRPYMGRRAMSSALFAAIALALIGAFAPGARAATPTAAPPPISAAQARQALDILVDPARRAQVVTTLEAIVRAEAVNSASHPPPPAIAAAASPTPATTPKPPPAIKLNPNSLGAAMVLGARGFLGNLWTRTAEATRAVQSLPLLWGWIVVMTTNPMAHGILRAAAWRVAVAFAAGIAVEMAVRRLLRRPVAVLEMRAPPANGASRSVRPEDEAESGEARAESGETEPPRPRRVAALTLLRRLPLVFARLLLDLMPVLAFAVVGHIVAVSDLGGTEPSRLVVLAMVDAYAISAGTMSFVRMMLSPDGRRLRLLRVSDATAVWAARWMRRLIVVAVFGYAIAEVGLALGMSQPAHDGLLKIAGLLNHVFMGVMVVQKRRAVKNFLRAPAGATGPLARLRNALAPVWHWIALFFLVAI